MKVWKRFGLNELDKQNQVSSVVTAAIWCVGFIVVAYFIWGN
jgi:hypothetical protein